ncbi:MAG: hypothetical protein NW220_01690 [Leptolyngbyaceae cyanobacterium bins.349]|nr:hypothetical protein [Leptolyngbyaceae cyanobacterium bins.349]
MGLEPDSGLVRSPVNEFTLTHRTHQTNGGVVSVVRLCSYTEGVSYSGFKAMVKLSVPVHLQPIQGVTMTEFYQGWMIQLVVAEAQFQFICSSPTGEELTNTTVYPNQLNAFRAAFTLIDRLLACYALRLVLREIFEANTLSFEEWEKLNQFLDYTARVQFSRSPFSPK